MNLNLNLMKKVSCLAWSKIRCSTIMRTAPVNFCFFHNSKFKPRWQKNSNMEQSGKWFDFLCCKGPGGLWLSNHISVFIFYIYTLQYFVQNIIYPMYVYSLFEKQLYKLHVFMYASTKIRFIFSYNNSCIVYVLFLSL